MPEIDCTLTSHSLAEHLRPVYTGFLLLHRRGVIRLLQHCTHEAVATPDLQHLRDTSGAHLRVLLDHRIRLHYYVHDSHEIHPAKVERCDFYFKRSFLRPYVDRLPRGSEKILPLGLNYSVLPDCVDAPALQRALLLAANPLQKLLACVDALDSQNVLRYNARLRDLEAEPDCNAPPKVLFLVNAYDPFDRPDRTPEKIEEYTWINETRARCILLLRKELGPNVLAGFTHNPYTRRQYPGLLAERHAVTRKKNYLRTVRSHGICVATTGLHGSIGWKFAEYISLGRAIVSERLRHEVPGDLRAGRNYLEFGTPEECVGRCVQLLQDRLARARMVLANAKYYRQYVRPDSMVLNTLREARCENFAVWRPSPLPKEAATPII